MQQGCLPKTKLGGKRNNITYYETAKKDDTVRLYRHRRIEIAIARTRLNLETILYNGGRPTMPITNEVSSFQLDSLEAVVKKNLRGIKNIRHDEDSVLFDFHDKDGDDITSFFQIINETQLRGMLILPVPESHIISAMIATGVYNGRPDIHGTYACMAKTGDTMGVCLEMDLDIEGGASEANISHKLQTFVDHINLFETKIMGQISELGEDSSFMKGGFWENAGAFFGRLVKELGRD